MMRKLSINWKSGSHLLLFMLLPVFMLLSLEYGITWDEDTHQVYGKLVYKFYQSGFSDKEATTYSNLYFYGGMFDLFSAIAQEYLLFMNEFTVRHLLNAIFGWIGFYYLMRLASWLGGWRAALISLVLLGLSPFYVGHMMNNPKDVPFASAYIMCLFYLTKLTYQYPEIRARTIIKLLLGLAFAINARVGGIMVVGYLGLLTGVLLLRDIWQTRKLTIGIIGRGAFLGLFCPLVSIPLGTVFWPWALESPWRKSYEALATVSKFPWAGDILYAGQMVFSGDLPWHYVPGWYAVSIPLLVLCAGLGGLLLIANRQLFVKILALAFVIAFPMFYVILKHSVLYDGIRHLLFIYPPFVIVAALALNWLYDAASHLSSPRKMRYAFGIIVTLLLVDPVWFTIRNHGHLSVYFNPLVGGTRGAFLSYELDYWGNCRKEAFDWINRQAKATTDVVSFGGDGPIAIYARHGIAPDNLHFINNKDGDYYIKLLRARPEYIEKSLASDKIFYTVQAQGAPLCLVVAGKQRGGSL